MTENTKPPSGSIDAVQLSLGFDTESVLGGAEAVDKLTDAVIKSTDALISNNDSAAENLRWLTESKRKWMELEAQIKKESEAALEADRAQKAIASANDAQEKAAQNLIIKLNELVKTFGLSTEGMLRYKAEQLGIADAAEPMIKKLEDLNRAQREASIQRERDIETFKAQQKEEQAALEAKVKAEKDAAKAAQERAEIEQKRDIELHNRRTKIYQEEEVALRRQAELQQKRDVEMRDMRAKEIAQQESNAKKAAQIEEQRAVDEVKFARMALDKKIEMLKKYNELLMGGVSPDRAGQEVRNSAAGAHLGELPGLMHQYQAELKSVETAHAKGKHSADSFGEALGLISFQSARARSELIVLAHEAVQGRFSRMPASMMVLAEYTNMASLAFTGIGQTVLGVGVALAALSVYIVKGINEQKEMNDSLIFTGNIAGQTSESLMQVATSVSHFYGSIGVAKEAVMGLAASGRFTSESFQIVAEAVTAWETATGRSTDKVIAEFERLAQQSTGHTKRASENISIALIKLDDQYHFLTSSVYEQIRSLELEGRQREASQLAMETYAEIIKARAAESAANLGTIEKAWKGIKEAASDAVNWMMGLGKADGPEKKMADALKEQANAREKIKLLNEGPHDRLTSSRVATAQEELNAANQKVIASSKELMQIKERAFELEDRAARQSDANHAKQAIFQQQTEIQKKSLGQLNVAIREYGERLQMIARDDPNSKLLDPDEVSRHFAAIVKEHTEKAPKAKTPKGSDDRQALLREEISDIKQRERIELASYKAQYEVLDQYNRQGVISNDVAYEAKLETLQAEERAKVDSLNKQLAAIKEFNAKTNVEIANTSRMRKEAESKITETVVEEAARRTRLTSQKQLSDQQDFEKLVANIGKEGQSDVSDLEKRIDKQNEYNDAIGKTKEAMDSARLATEQRKMLQNESDALFLEDLLQDSSLNEKQVAIFTARMVWLQRIVAKQKELIALQGIAQKEDASVAAAKLLSKQLDDAVDSAKRFGRSMKEAFGSTGEAIGGVLIALAEYNKRENDIAETKKKALQLAGDNDGQKRIAEQKAIEESQMNQLQTFGDMAGAAKGFFSEQSSGYKTMMGLQKIAHALQVAMMIKEMYLLAAKAVANQASGGDPYTAWARMAAMAAAMATLGYAVGGGFNKTSGQDLTKENQQKKQGIGRILGDADAKSESLLKAMESLADNSDETMPLSQEMLRSLRAIENSMKALSSIVARTVGLTSGNPAGFQPSFEKKLGGLWGSKKVELEDTGLTINGVSVAQLIAGMGVGQYATTKTTEKSFFGLKKDIDYNRFVSGTDPDIQKQVTLVMKSLTDGLVTASKSFGYNSNEVKSFIESIQFSNFNVSLKDLKGDDLTNALNNWLSGMADDVVKLTFASEPTLAQFQKIGEGAAETIIRVASGIEQASSLLASLGIDTVDWRDVALKQADVAAEIVRQSIVAAEGMSGVSSIMKTLDGNASELVTTYRSLLQVQRQLNNAGLGEISASMLQGAGGISELGKSLDVFLDKFYTDKEKADRLQKNLAEDFSKLGLAVPSTRKDFRALVEVLNRDTSEAGRKLLARVLALADSFDTTASAVENVTGVVEDGTQAIVDAWKGVTESIVEEVRRIRKEALGGGEQSYGAAASAFAIGNAKASAGDMEAAKQLPTLARDMLDLASSSAGSLEELNRIRIMTANTLESTAKYLEEKYGFKIPGFASGGDHQGGYRIVGEDGPEIEATGRARIFSSQQSRAILNGETVQELRALRQEVAGLRSENQAAQIAIARNTEKMQKVLTRNDTGKGLLTTDTIE